MTEKTPTPNDMPRKKNEPKQDDETQYIVYREGYVDEGGVQQVKEHRVPLSDWAEYAKENGL